LNLLLNKFKFSDTWYFNSFKQWREPR